MFARRQFLKWSGAAVTAAALAPLAARTVAAPANVAAAAAVVDDPAALEAQAGGRLGVSLWHPASGRRSGHRQHERFPMCSTFKLPLAAAVLYRADQGRLSLEQRLPVRAGDMVDFSPICQRHIGKDMTVRELCRATMIRSDNTAANLLLPLLDGPAGLTALLRQLGDTVTLSARYEPEANAYAAGDPRDTTSPAAMADNLQRLVLGKVLAPASRQQLADWLIDNETGERRLRAGLSAAWRVGDKTGSNGRDTTNDVAVLWPLAEGTPWILTSYLQGAQVDSDGRDAILRRVAQWAQTQIG